VKLWDLETGLEIATFHGATSAVTACAVTPDGRRVIAASRDETLRIWNRDTGALLSTFQGHAGKVTACAVTPDGRRVVSASADHTLKVWNIENGGVLATFQGHAAKVTACAVTPDGRRVVSASGDRTLKVWDLDNVNVLPTFEGHAGWVTACAVTSDGRRVISTSYDRTMKVWGLDSGRALATFGEHASRVTACAVTPDDRWVVSACTDLLRIWDLHSGDLISTLDGHDGMVTACAMTPDGRRVVSASEDYSLQVWDLETGLSCAVLEGHADAVHACAVTHDGRRVVSGSEDQTLRVWDLDLRRRGAFSTVGVHEGRVSACAVTPDDRRVISASFDKTLKVWDLQSGRLLATLEGHAGAVHACAVTPDGRRAVSASEDHTLRVWDLETYGCLLIHRGECSYITVATTTTAIVAGDVAGTVWFLDWPPSMAPLPLVATPGAASPSSPASITPRRNRKRSPARHVLLFLAANPTGTSRLALDQECAAIEEELRGTTGRDDFDFRSKWAVGIDEMMRHLNAVKPAIIHFSGHGEPGDGYIQEASIQLHGQQHQPQPVNARALTAMIASAAPSTRVVVLNACFTDAMAEAVREVVDCVVGMRGAIVDDSARSFAVGFYRALGNRRSVGNAFAQAVAVLAAKQLPDEHLPICRTRDGVRSERVTLGKRRR
jgi:WD40 repeat protein